MNPAIAAALEKFNIRPDEFDQYPGNADVVWAEVPGEIAFELWRTISALHGTTGVWPVLRGEDLGGDVDSVEEPSAIPPSGEVESLLRSRFAEFKETYATGLGAGASKLSMMDFAARADEQGIFGAEEDDEDDEDEDGEGEDEWPEEPPDAELSFSTLRQWDSDEPIEFVHFALVSVKHPWEVFERLPFGGYNECPSPSLLSALFREWHSKFGAVPVAVTHEVVECLVARPPQNEADSWRLAVEQLVTCEDIVVQGTLSVRNLAKGLWRAPTWYFWWD